MPGLSHPCFEFTVWLFQDVYDSSTVSSTIQTRVLSGFNAKFCSACSSSHSRLFHALEYAVNSLSFLHSAQRNQDIYQSVSAPPRIANHFSDFIRLILLVWCTITIVEFVFRPFSCWDPWWPWSSHCFIDCLFHCKASRGLSMINDHGFVSLKGIHNHGYRTWSFSRKKTVVDYILFVLGPGYDLGNNLFISFLSAGSLLLRVKIF